MKTIMDLPREVFTLIVATAIQEIVPKHDPSTPVELERRDRGKREARTRLISAMRVLNRNWANWLYKTQFDTLSFASHDDLHVFMDALDHRSITHQELPQCRYLKVHQIWGWLQIVPPPCKIQFSVLDSLLERFTETIVVLDIQVVNYFTLPMATIERIGRLPNLRFLRLGIFFTRRGSKNFKHTNVDLIPNDLPTDSECLLSLLRAAEKVVYLDLTDFRPVCSPGSLGDNLGDYQFRGLKALKLDVKTCLNLTQVGIEKLSGRLPNLKVLWIGGNGHEEGELLVPLFRILRGQLEEIFFNEERVMESILDLRFPKLRVLRLHEWGKNLSVYLQQPMLEHANLQVLALHCFPFHKVKKHASLSVPFQTLRHLRRLEFHEATAYPPPDKLIQECEDHEVECVFPHHDDVGEDGRLNLDFDPPTVLRNHFRI